MHVTGGRTDDLGPMVRLPCAECGTVRWFRLRRHSVAAGVLGIEFSKSSGFTVDCEECGFAMDLSGDDARKGVDFLPTARQFSAGKMTEKEFLVRLGDAGFRFLQEFAEANTNWVCPKCGEESPMTFSSCWKCDAAREGTGQDPSGVPPKTPGLDRALGNDDGPLGPLRL